MKDVIVLVGKNGAGKGSRLSELWEGREDQFMKVSTSILLKREIAKGTEVGKQIEAYRSASKLVPDEIVNPLVINAIKSADKTVIIDGFPRTLGQAEAMIEAGIQPKMVIEIYLDDEIVMERLSDRICCESCTEPYTMSSYNPPKVPGICDKCGGKLARRKDDEPEAIKQRLDDYREKTYPVLDYFSCNGSEVVVVDNSDGKQALKDLEELIL